MLVSCCRLVTIQFYIYDNEVQIIEPKVTNAGESNPQLRCVSTVTVLYAQLSTTGVLCDIPCQHILTLSLANATIGMPHGTFFRKGVIHLDDGRPLQLKDLVVGGDIKMLGQEFFITDADEFTRKYFQYVYTKICPLVVVIALCQM
jgi:hypothetical protein